MVATVFVTAAVGTDVTASLVVLAIALWAYAAVVRDVRASLATAGLAYLLFDGLLVNGYGELSWTGTTSTWHVTVLALAAGLGIWMHRLRTTRVQAAMERELSELLTYVQSTPKKEMHGA